MKRESQLPVSRVPAWMFAIAAACAVAAQATPVRTGLAATATPAPVPTVAPVSAVAPSTSAPAIRGPISRLAWLAGCWRRETPARVVEEQWMAPAGGLMLGVSRTVSPGDQRLIEYEVMRIEEKDGGLVFTARPSGQSEASFPSVELGDSLVVFENLAHDFPQRVAYRRAHDGSLRAWIEGTVDGKPRQVEFPYGRAACPTGTAP